MKKVSICFLLLFVGGGFQGFAQGSSDSGFKTGIRAGWHYAGMFRSGTQQYDNLNAFYVGLFSEMQSSENLATGSGLEYFQNGFTNEGKNFKMHTLSIPIYIKPTIGPVFGTAGLALNFKLTDNREDFPDEVKDTKFFDLPLTLGAGVQLGVFVIEAKYYWGLFDAASINGEMHKNRYLQIGGALRF